MQSSPPTRAWERPSSPAGSHYSLDLGDLELDSDSGGSRTPVAKQHVEQVLSEDIDGPTDFTINLGKWMKGGTTGNRSAGVLQTLREHGVESPTGEEERTASHHTPNGSPPKVSVYQRDDDHEDTGHDTSDWDPYNSERSTPKPPPHKELNPTVEEYYSELMPSGSQSVHPALRHSLNTAAGKDDARASSPTLSPVRSPVIQRSTNQNNDFESQLKRFQDRCQQLEQLNNTLNQSLDEERKKRADEGVQRKAINANDGHSAELARLNKAMENMKTQHARELRSLQHEHDLVRRNRDDAEESARMHQAELEEYRESHELELNRLNLELQQADTVSPVDEETQKQLHAAEEAKRRAEKQAGDLLQNLKDLRKQLLDEQAAHDEELRRMESNGKQPGADASELESLRNELESKQSVINDLTIDRDSAQDDLAALRTELQETKDHLADTEAVNIALDARISDAMQRREAYWRERLDKEERERTVMAKALLHQWGREEVGISKPQGFEFKYVDRKSKVGV